MKTLFPELFRILVDAKIEFIVVGGAAAIAHGSARLTQDWTSFTGAPRKISIEL
jgi:hypothetical protein